MINLLQINDYVYILVKFFVICIRELNITNVNYVSILVEPFVICIRELNITNVKGESK